MASRIDGAAGGGGTWTDDGAASLPPPPRKTDDLEGVVSAVLCSALGVSQCRWPARNHTPLQVAWYVRGGQ